MMKTKTLKLWGNEVGVILNILAPPCGEAMKRDALPVYHYKLYSCSSLLPQVLLKPGQAYVLKVQMKSDLYFSTCSCLLPWRNPQLRFFFWLFSFLLGVHPLTWSFWSFLQFLFYIFFKTLLELQMFLQSGSFCGCSCRFTSARRVRTSLQHSGDKGLLGNLGVCKQVRSRVRRADSAGSSHSGTWWVFLNPSPAPLACLPVNHQRSDVAFDHEWNCSYRTDVVLKSWTDPNAGSPFICFLWNVKPEHF